MLAEKLGKTRGQLLREMSTNEFFQWAAFLEIQHEEKMEILNSKK